MHKANILIIFIFFISCSTVKEEKVVVASKTFSDSNLGRWFLMDAGDIDNDGDLDIVLSAFTLSFTPLPSELVELWKETDADIMVLLNQLN